MADTDAYTDSGRIVIMRLHRLVRHGWRPWLGYGADSGQDAAIHLRRKRAVATILPDGTVTLANPAEAAPRVMPADDAAGFDALFPASAPNVRNLMRRLYEIGV